METEILYNIQEDSVDYLPLQKKRPLGKKSEGKLE